MSSSTEGKIHSEEPVLKPQLEASLSQAANYWLRNDSFKKDLFCDCVFMFVYNRYVTAQVQSKDKNAFCFGPQGSKLRSDKCFYPLHHLPGPWKLLINKGTY